MTVVRIQAAIVEPLVIFLDVTHLGHLQQVVAGIHLHTQGIEGTHHLLGIHQYQFQLGRMFLVKQGGNHGIQAHRLTLTSGTSHQHVRHLCQVDDKRLVTDGLTQYHRQFSLTLLERLAAYDTLSRHHSWRLVRHLDTDGTLARNRRNDTNTQSS